MGLDKVDEAATGLARLRGKACANEKADVPEPSFMAIITGVGETAYRRSDGIYVIPVRTLGGHKVRRRSCRTNESISRLA